jgi:hypothetical protein
MQQAGEVILIPTEDEVRELLGPEAVEFIDKFAKFFVENYAEWWRKQ